MDLIERLNKGPILCAEGYLFAMERRGYLQAGSYVPEVVLEHPEVVTQLHREFNNANQRLGDLLFGHAHGIVIRTVRGAFRANRYMAARQFRFIPFGHDILQSKR